MSILLRHSSRRAIAVLMSFVWGLAILLPTGSGTAYAGGLYTPITPVESGYTGDLTWKDYSPPVTPGTVTAGVYAPLFIDIDNDNNIFATMYQGFQTSVNPTDTPTYIGKVVKISNNGQTETDITYDGDFHYPVGIAVDNAGNVYVADNPSSTLSPENTTNPSSTIKKLPVGTQSWITLAVSDPLKFVYGVAVDRQGTVYAVENNRYGINPSTVPAPPTPPPARILQLPSGSSTWTPVPGSSAISYPIDIVVDGEGNLFVSDMPTYTPPATGYGKIHKLPVGGSVWEDVSPKDESGTPIPFIAYGLGVDKFDNVLAINMNVEIVSIGGPIIYGSAMKLGYNGGSQDWTKARVIPTTSIPVFSLDIAADSSGYIFGTSVTTANIVRLMASIGYSSNDPMAGLPPVDNTGYLPGVTATVYGNVTSMTKPGYTFSGWSTDPAATSASYVAGDTITMNQSVMLYAVWTPIPSFTVTYQTQTGGTLSGSGTETVYSGNSPIAVPTVTTDPGYTFLGWSSDGGTTLLTRDELAAAIITGNVTYTARIQAPVTVSSIVLDDDTYSLQPSQTHQTVVTAIYSDESTSVLSTGVTFSSSDQNVATVNSEGLVTAVADGQTVITAEYGSHQAHATVSVSSIILASLTLDSTSYSLEIGGTHQTVVTAVYSDESTLPLTSGVTYTSSDTTVASVSAEGLVTAAGAGQAEITIEHGGLQARVDVTVHAAASNDPVITTPVNPIKEVEVYVDGVKQDTLATLKEDTVGGQKVSTIVVDSQKVIEKMEKDSNKTLTLPLSGDSQVVVGQLTGALVKSLESNDAVIEIVTDRGTYKLPASQINIDSISAQVGANVKLEDIVIEIRISVTTEENASKVEADAKANNYELIGKPVDFEVTASYGQTSIDANQFNSYVERTISLPDDIDPSSITTGVVLTAKGELFHVPTLVTEKNGKKVATINSLTNSTYSVIHNPREMDDVKTHWARADVNDMNSRLVIQGVTATEFRPDAAITRAEFAAIVTRGLGVQGAAYAGSFSDVSATEWYAEAVQAAVNYKLFDGYEDGRFRPNQNISRQEATAVLTRAASIAKLKTELPAAEVTRLLSPFTDGSQVAGWAQANVAAAISLNLMNGRGDTLDVAANLTRAETAALVRRLLQAANLINK
ncbi:S-layer homology domain-containing protein [Paenibacillus koleovorans]|uniref:S-layer homology domain-containing protein n=1 Tax=Paenibacillus koleovorans TaxID=121608 RepID=UPI000FD8ADB8|nr:S-layer homology domain-containing protein [Paenibacillus koleovorans]